jgi:hypothetical protein
MKVRFVFQARTIGALTFCIPATLGQSHVGHHPLSVGDHIRCQSALDPETSYLERRNAADLYAARTCVKTPKSKSAR